METLIAFNTPADGKWMRQSQWLMTDAADQAIKVRLLHPAQKNDISVLIGRSEARVFEAQ